MSFDFDELPLYEPTFKQKAKANLSFESSKSHNIYNPEFSSDEEEPAQIKTTEEEDYRQLEEYFIASSDSESPVKEIDIKYVSQQTWIRPQSDIVFSDNKFTSLSQRNN